MRFKIEIATNEFEIFVTKMQKIDPPFRWTRKTDTGLLTKANFTDDAY